MTNFINWFWNGGLFLVGLCLGSFFNVIIFRSLNNENWLGGRSKCDHCGQQLHWYDNVPLVSFLILKGRSRCCQQTISLIHPLVELATGIGLVTVSWAVMKFQVPQNINHILIFSFWCLVFAVSWLVFLFDLKAMIIPDSLVLVLTFLSLIKITLFLSSGLLTQDQLLIDFGVTLALVLFFLSLWWITGKKGFGLGDVKLAFPLGLILGYPSLIVGVFLAFIIGAIWGIILIINQKKKFGQVLPFGPFLVTGFWFSLIWGTELWDYYWHQLII